MKIKSIMKLEMKRGVRNRYFLIALLIGTGICLYQAIQCIDVIRVLQETMLDYPEKIEYPSSVFNQWIGGNIRDHTCSMLYYFLLPILAVLPYGVSFYDDLEEEYLKNILLRTKRVNYYIAKYIAVFLTGGIVVVMPLIINLVTMLAMAPSIAPEVSTGMFAVSAPAMAAELFYTHPFVYIAMYLIIDFVFGGLLATIAVVVGFFVHNRFVVLIVPFLLYTLYDYIVGFLGLNSWVMNTVLQPSQVTSPTAISLLVMAGVLLLVTAGIFIGKGKRCEVY